MKINENVFIIGEHVDHKDENGQTAHGVVSKFNTEQTDAQIVFNDGSWMWIPKRKDLLPNQWTIVPCVVLHRGAYAVNTTIESSVFPLSEKEYRVNKCLWNVSFIKERNAVKAELQRQIVALQNNIRKLGG